MRTDSRIALINTHCLETSQVADFVIESLVLVKRSPGPAASFVSFVKAMKKIPNLVRDHILNARYYFEAACEFPSPRRDGVKLSLLFTAWENIHIAEEELSAYIQNKTAHKDLYKTHQYKLEGIPPIDKITVEVVNGVGKAKTITYSTGEQFSKLHQICRYGHKDGIKKLPLIFKKGWFLDDFENSLLGKIEWLETMVDKVYPELMNKNSN